SLPLPPPLSLSHTHMHILTLSHTHTTLQQTKVTSMTLAECVHTSTQSHMRDDLPVASEPPHLRCLTVFGVFLSQTRAAQHSPKITHYHCLPFFSVATADHCCVYD